MKAKKLFSLFLSAAILSVVLCACGDNKTQGSADGETASASGETVSGGELVIGIAQDLGESLDPYQMTAAGTREVLFNVYEGLVKPASDGSFVPAIAKEAIPSEDGLTYRFPLREGVLFHNGAKVTTEDVIESFKNCAATSVDSALVGALSAVTEVKAGEPNEVVVTLSAANPDFLSFVSSVYIVPAGYADNATKPVGTGPYVFASRSVQENVVFTRFADYWGTPGKLDKITCQIYEDNTALMSALGGGTVDLVAHLTVDQADTLAGGEYTVLEGTMNLVQALYLNHKHQPFDNPLVRQAMCWAVDVDELLALTANGHGTKVGSSMYPAFTKYFDASLADLYGYDPEKARALLEEAGYADGFDMTITVPSNYTPHMNAAEVLVEQLGRVGIRAQILGVEWESWVSKTYTDREFESTVIGFDATSLTAGAMLNRWISDNGKNMINYNNPAYDKVMEEANASTDEARRTELYGQAQRILAEDAANVYLQDMADFVALRNTVSGYTFYPLYVMDFSTLGYNKT